MAVLNKNTDMQALKKLLKSKTNHSTRGFDAKRFSGALKTDVDALAIQKKLRNEWK